jgi:hypothetical protein
MCDEVDEPAPSLEISAPDGSAPAPQGAWNLIAYNKKALKGWEALCLSLTENSTRCYEWLRAHPNRPIPGRCYQLKHKHYADTWGYEIGTGQRVYYKMREAKREVVIYYAGPHPTKVPCPPADL